MRFHGFVAPYEGMEAAKQAAEHPVSQRPCYHICDFTDLTYDSEFTMSEDVAKSVAPRVGKLFAEIGVPTYVAMVTKSHRMREFLELLVVQEGHPPEHRYAIFSVMKDARAWVAAELGVDLPSFD
jgi:hypothetical protein